MAFSVFLGTLAALLVAGLLLLLLLRRVSFGIFLPPSPTMAAAKQVPDCTVPNDASSLGALNATVTGGVLRAPRIVVPQALTLNLTSSLILVADDLLQVDGIITLAANLPQGRIVDVTLVCLNGNVVIGVGGQVGSFRAAAASAPADTSANLLLARASGDAGTNGGAIRILAPQGTIDVQGSVYGFSGGDGGAATATGTGFVIPIPAPATVIGGSGGAAGGQGGAGGDVILCALDGIRIAGGGAVFGSFGGNGGTATATATLGEDALAAGGPGNGGGDVILQGLAAGMQVSNGGLLFGGQGGAGRTATATGAPAALSDGGEADASGGMGGAGGTVLFRQCVVQPVGLVSARFGGDGGTAIAFGGFGAPGIFLGGDGGDATAVGGDAGAAGALPVIPLPGGGTRQGVRPVFPTPIGGDAGASPGNGGGGRLRGGSSGAGSATGGTGNSGTAATPVTTPSAGPTGGAGGVATPAASRGTP